MTSIPLTRRQRDIVAFLEHYQQQHSISPTLEEIAQHLGVNKVTVFGHVAELERKGVLVRRLKRASRSLEMVAPTREAERATSAVAILGSIAAGSPIETLENPEPLPLQDWTESASGVDRYALRVRGDSMIEDCICDGDVVLVERRTEARDGETVVAILGGDQATLKRLYREGPLVRLQPANSRLKPIRVSAAELDIRGVVVGVLRSLR